jgi:ATP-dependent helicase/nuclease subunit B
MPKLTLLIGPAGSGKTERVLGAIAAQAAEHPWPTPEHPPLLLIVPEQQAATLERALLARLAAGDPAEATATAERAAGTTTTDAAAAGCTVAEAATARVRVMSLTRLARWLMDQAGEAPRTPSETGRRLLVWQLLPASPTRDAEAAVLAEALAEALQYGVAPVQLRERAAELRLAGDSGQAARLAEKLAQLAELLERYGEACTARGLSFAPPLARIPELLTAEHWPLLEQTRVWVDGFAGFTPPEEHALAALLARCAELTAAVLLDPAQRDAPAVHAPYDWYAPTRELRSRWLLLAQAAGAAVSEIELAQPRRWTAGSTLGALAGRFTAINEGGALPASPGGGSAELGLPGVCIRVCGNEREELEQAARLIATLVRPPALGGRGWRYRELSVITRRLEPYAALAALVFAGHGIPYFIDQRRSVAHHPAVELLRCGLRLALGQAADEDVYTLLKTDLLPGGEGARDRADQVEQYARACALHPSDWLRDKPWRWRRRLLRREDQRDVAGGEAGAAAQRAAQALAQLDFWRRELLAPIASLAEAWRALAPEQRTVRAACALAWQHLYTAEVAPTLAAWSAGAGGQAGGALTAVDEHSGVLAAIAALLDELVLIAGEMALPPSELCAWLEAGLADLSVGYPPPALDCVLVTDIERGRQHEVKAALLLGLSEDLWPGAAGETAFFSDAERRRLNRRGKLLAGGAAERSAREPYLALIAATRPAELLYLSCPAGDAEGRQRQRSPYLELYRAWLDPAAGQATETAPLLPSTAQELFIQAALAPGDGQLAAAADELAGTAPVLRVALRWSRGEAAMRGALPPLPEPLLRELLLYGQAAAPLSMSVSRLELFAACPLKHYARYYLMLAEPEERGLGPLELGGFYHSLFQHVVREAGKVGWEGLALEELQAIGARVLRELGASLAGETGRLRAAYVLERGGILLEHHLRLLHARVAQRGLRPVAAELRFGAGDRLPALEVPLPGGVLKLHGYIDRLDADAAGQARVVDYKLGARQTNWAGMLAGAELQLLAYALAVDAAQLEPETPALKAAGAEYQGIEPQWRKGRADFSPQPVAPEAKQEALQQAVAGLWPRALEEARRVMVELGGRILAGEIAPLPLRWGKGDAACAGCAYRALCRFDPLAGGRYRDALAGNAGLRNAIAAGVRDFAGSALNPALPLALPGAEGRE